MKFFVVELEPRACALLFTGSLRKDSIEPEKVWLVNAEGKDVALVEANRVTEVTGRDAELLSKEYSQGIIKRIKRN